MQSNYGSAISHIQSGLKILVQFARKQQSHLILQSSEVPYVSMEMLEEIFMRLDLQVSQVRSRKLTH